MQFPSVYLAGPIAGLGYDAATDWRVMATQWLLMRGLKGLSPMRDKEYLKDVATFSGTCGPEAGMGPLSGSRAVMTRDHFDVQRCDVVLVNFLGAERVSIETVMEIAWAYAYRKPVVLVSEDDGHLHDHAMLTEAVGFRASTLQGGLEICRAILG